MSTIAAHLDVNKLNHADKQQLALLASRRSVASDNAAALALL